MNRDLEFAHEEAEESLNAYYSRHTARSWQEYLASSPEALAERAAERLPLEPETAAAMDRLLKRSFQPVNKVLERHGFLYRNLCHEHRCSEATALPEVSRWRASTWHTVERADCEMCGEETGNA